MSNGQIIREELQKIADEATEIYNNSGKRVKGNWLNGLSVENEVNKGSLYSYEYLSGRGATVNGKASRPTLLKKITQWIKDRGIKPIEDNMKVSTLAFLITRKIHKEGTNKRYHINPFTDILTPKRVDEIINKVGQFNASQFVNDVLVIMKRTEKKL